jgi:hypothetical protein
MAARPELAWAAFWFSFAVERAMFEIVPHGNRWLIGRRVVGPILQMSVGLSGSQFATEQPDPLTFWTGEAWTTAKASGKRFNNKIEANMYLSYNQARMEATK